MAKELLLEIGTEEIPAAFLPKALKDIERIIKKDFSENRIRHGAIMTMGTPRRLVLCVREVAEKQDDQVIEKVGPATRAAFDDEGNPTKAAMGFARGQGLEVSELETITNDKGEYLCARKKVIGEDTATFLSDTLPRLITSIPFQKSMRWMNLDLRFARPIHWILALFGGEVVSFKIENVESGACSFGHRFMSPEFFEVSNFEDYLKKTKDHFIIADPEKRKSIIIEEARKAATDVAGEVLENEDLLNEVTFLVEYPSVVLGNFDREYLDLPKEVLTTSMIKHQKYFPVTDGEGKLLPHFITVNNTLARDPSVVARGNEKVIRARLADAQFFFEEDRKTPLENHLEDLKDVVFHSALGTSYEKVMQFRELALYITETLNLPIKATVDRTALLAKADLETQMVYEFTELQGVMGREYARIQGEDPVVAKAIYEHYLPVAAGGDLPESDEGAIVSIADKMDTIVGFFGINLVPTGTADPFALRRQALGIINIILNRNYPLNLDALIDKSIAILGEKLKRKPEETKADVLDFFRGRFENQLISQGHPYDVVNAVLALGLSDIVQSLRKIEAMEDFKEHPDYEPLAVAFKRVVNILKGFEGGSVDTELFQEKEEENLHKAFLDISEKAKNFINDEKYNEALSEVARLRKSVDAFFDTVLVMAEDERVKFNRLSLLEELKTLFYGIADFTKIVTDG
ncbi:MAG: glycine--tRNA ligase subunit beta [Deltaproteobacteria bacterium]|nr:glycine--tRNA ligase subunit beta [Deltaproteobacteria bacterium]MBN2844746.1 glycine--tRNA ligase subunit beta [Deltaproteobacteria bacterium]